MAGDVVAELSALDGVVVGQTDAVGLLQAR